MRREFSDHNAIEMTLPNKLDRFSSATSKAYLG